METRKKTQEELREEEEARRDQLVLALAQAENRIAWELAEKKRKGEGK